jgi:hypothetical protein
VFHQESLQIALGQMLRVTKDSNRPIAVGGQTSGKLVAFAREILLQISVPKHDSLVPPMSRSILRANYDCSYVNH